jgi:metallo-beta-lactamase family protein
MLEELSAHADQVEILGWLSHFDHAPHETLVLHGEPAAADALRLRIEEPGGRVEKRAIPKSELPGREGEASRTGRVPSRR